MKKLFALLVLVFSISAFGNSPLIQCDAKVPGYERFRMNLQYDDINNPKIGLFLIQGGIAGYWRVNGIRLDSNNDIIRTQFMLNEQEFAVLNVPAEILEADFNTIFESKLELANSTHKTTCFVIQ